ncbi:MAG: hypothetical protein NDI94_03305 [Candidatus Woesearchaeota archaeon]|nr:hypothetical protein [Candidatus Woesearchaeota archaeon]
MQDNDRFPTIDMTLFDKDMSPNMDKLLEQFHTYYTSLSIDNYREKACRMCRDKILIGLGIDRQPELDNPLRFTNIYAVGLTLEVITVAYIGPNRDNIHANAKEIMAFLPKNDIMYRSICDQNRFVADLKDKLFEFASMLSNPEKVY